MISCLAIHTTDRSEKHKRKLCHKSSVIGVPNLLVVVSQNKEGREGGGSRSSSVQILIDNETGHKKEIEERKKASKSATILYCTTQESH